MKQTFYLHKYIKGDVVLSVESQLRELKPIGTIELDVQPIKKEVLKSTNVPLVEGWDGYCHVSQHLVIPKTAYDVTITYKVEE
jgi:hypothetical protein